MPRLNTDPNWVPGDPLYFDDEVIWSTCVTHGISWDDLYAAGCPACLAIHYVRHRIYLLPPVGPLES